MITYEVKVHGNGYTEWWLDGKRHRTDGPAVEDTNGYKAWYLNGKEVIESEVMENKHTIVFDGKEIKLSNESYQEIKKAFSL